jgi:hypothetical protein
MNDAPNDLATSTAPRYTRRLTDKILIAFQEACDRRDLEVAEQLLRVLETAMSPRQRRPGAKDRRRDKGSLVAAYERLWDLRHPDPVRSVRRGQVM